MACFFVRLLEVVQVAEAGQIFEGTESFLGAIEIGVTDAMSEK